MEAHPDWARLLDDDREEIAARLDPAVEGVEGVDTENPVRSLRTVLVRRSTVPGGPRGRSTAPWRSAPGPGVDLDREKEARTACPRPAMFVRGDSIPIYAHPGQDA